MCVCVCVCTGARARVARQVRKLSDRLSAQTVELHEAKNTMDLQVPAVHSRLFSACSLQAVECAQCVVCRAESAEGQLASFHGPALGVCAASALPTLIYSALI